MPTLQELLAAEAAYGAVRLRTLSSEFSDLLERLPAFKREMDRLAETPNIDLPELSLCLEQNLIFATDWLHAYDMLQPSIRGLPMIQNFMIRAREDACSHTIKKIREDFDLLPEIIRADPEKFELATRGYVDNLDGTITDVNSGLMWKRQSEGKFLWEDAMEITSSRIPHKFAGFFNWRIPSLIELKSIVGNRPPYLCSVAFPGPQDWFWTSVELNNTSAWYVVLGTGAVNFADKFSHRFEVRLVRNQAENQIK